MSKYALEDWLVEADTPTLGGQPDAFGMQAPDTSPNQGMGAPPSMDPNIANQPDQMTPDQAQQMDLGDEEPENPEMPEEKDKEDDFEVWKKKFFQETTGGDVIKLLHMLSLVRDKEDMQPYHRKFVDDNWYIQKTREGNSNILNVSKQMRQALKKQLDRNNPATSVIGHLNDLLQAEPMLTSIFVKLSGYGGMKGDLHRKYIAALTNSVQVGNGANNADIIFNEVDYSIMMSTRLNSQFGEIQLGNWSLHQDDPEKFLSEPELKRLQSGSPEEKDVLRRRIVMESIAEQFETRAFIISVVDDDGTINHLGWDIANSLRAAYTEGKLVVRTKHSDNSECMIDDQGQILPLVDIQINYTKESGHHDDDGKPEKEEVPFLERKNGILFLTASSKTMQDSSAALSGMIYKQQPYVGNPSDLTALKRCIYTPSELLMKSC